MTAGFSPGAWRALGCSRLLFFVRLRRRYQHEIHRGSQSVEGLKKLTAQILSRAKRLVQYLFVMSLSDPGQNSAAGDGQIPPVFVG